MPGETHAETIRTFMTTVWDRADPAAADAFLAPGYVDHAYPGGDAAALKAQIALLGDCFSNGRHEVEDLLVEGDRVMIRARLKGRHTAPFRGIPPEGREVDVRVARWFRLEDGAIAEHWALLDTAGLLAQIGGGGQT